MISRDLFTKIVLLIGAILFTFSVGAYGNRQNERKRICVVAVHDSSLFTFCPPAFRKSLGDGLLRKLPPPGDPWYNSGFGSGNYQMYVSWDGRLGFRTINHVWSYYLPPALLLPDPNILERNRPDWQELSKLAAGICPSGWIDPGMSREIEDEIKKNKDYTLVNTVKDSDLVFLVEGLYRWYQSPVNGTWLSYDLFEETAGTPRSFRIVAIGVVVPAEIYRRNPVDVEALLSGRLWAGVSFYKHDLPQQPGGIRGLPSGELGNRTVYDGSSLVHSASPQELVRKFFRKEKWSSDIPPIGPAWSILPIPAAEAVTTEPNLRTGGAAQPGLPLDKPAYATGNPVFRANTTLVAVPVVARDMEGHFVSDLAATDFHIYENGVEQKIDRLVSESTPFQTALMMDVSHSTGIVQPAFESAALTFAKVLRPEDKLMVLSFTNKIYVESELTGDQDLLRHAIMRMDEHGGGAAYYGEDLTERTSDPTRQMGTRLYDAVDLVITERFAKLPGRKAMLIFTDGVDSGSRLANQQSTLARIEESDVLVYAIHFDTPVQKDINADRMAARVAAHAKGAEYLQQLADHSGGRLFKASTGAGFEQAFSYIAEEMGHQYTLAYYPKNPPSDSSFRRIEFKIDKPGIKIRSRTGYRPITTMSAAK
jgi:Ca-activated chloride channel family protein